jgi:hypothetical protein
MFPHASKQWSWHLFLRYRLEPMGCVGILLHDLCVIDVDCKAVCGELCERFPILLTTARERTLQGMHFFFRRSKRADTHGYYDGAAQKLTCVDFKTVCSNGTSGFLVVAPSANKKWVVAPWDLIELPEIPDDLLDAVARPKHRAVTTHIRMMATGEVRKFTDSVALGRLAYTAMFDEFPEVPVPIGDMASMDALIHGMDVGIVDPCFDDAFIEGVFKLADFLGLGVKDLKAMTERTKEARRLKVGHPEVFEVLSLDAGLLVDISNVASDIHFHPLELGTDAILKARELGLVPGERLIDYDFLHTLEDSLPETLVLMMQRFQSRIIIAGGYVTGEVTNCYGGGNDIDLFITGCGMDEGNEIVEAFLAEEAVRPVFRTANAITFRMDDRDGEPSIPVQIVLTLYESPEAVISGFDLDPCRACAFYEGSTLRVLTTPSWLLAVSTASYPVMSKRWTMSSTARIIKYAVKGFQPFVPGLDRSLVSHTSNPVMDFIVSMQTCEGISELVQAERSHAFQHGKGACLTYSTVGTLMTFIRMSRRHDYDVQGLGTKVVRSLKYLYARGALLLGFGSARGAKCGHMRLQSGNAAELLTWKPPIVGRGLNAYFPACAQLECVVRQ